MYVHSRVSDDQEVDIVLIQSVQAGKLAHGSISHGQNFGSTYLSIVHHYFPYSIRLDLMHNCQVAKLGSSLPSCRKMQEAARSWNGCKRFKKSEKYGDSSNSSRDSANQLWILPTNSPPHVL